MNPDGMQADIAFCRQCKGTHEDMKIVAMDERELGDMSAWWFLCPTTNEPTATVLRFVPRGKTEAGVSVLEGARLREEP